MSVIIEGMKMPKSCYECKLKEWVDNADYKKTGDYCCPLNIRLDDIEAYRHGVYDTRRLENCPLKELKGE